MTDRARHLACRISCACLCAGMTALLFFPRRCYAVGRPDLRIAQFYHTAWTAKEGGAPRV